MRRSAPVAWLMLTWLVGACGDAGTAPALPEGPDIRLMVDGLLPLDAAAAAQYEAWALDAEERFHSLGTVTPDAGGRWEGVLESTAEDAAVVLISIERTGEAAGRPSLRMVIGGAIRDGEASLEVTGYLTPNIPFEATPGAHILATHWESGPGDLPPREDAGIWLYDPAGDTADASLYLTFTPVTEGWTYGGWVVRDHGTPDEVWVSYGTFRPDPLRRASSRDYTGLGPFSGKTDYRRALPLAVSYPGEDWLANPLDLPVPAGLRLPFDLNGCTDAAGACLERGEEPGPSRWTHVITVEPYENRYLDPWTARPSPISVYRNAIGEAEPEVPREIRFLKDELPRGRAVIEPR
jgi:hypothetical protein